MPRPLFPTCFRAVLATFALACLARPAAGQFFKQDIDLKSPAHHQVVQRDANGLGEFPIVLPDDYQGAEILDAEVKRSNPRIGPDEKPFLDVPGARYLGGKVDRVPTGGPYVVWVKLRTKEGEGTIESRRFFVGDLWVLAGQSNMEGVGKLVDVTPPDDRVMALGMDGRWVRAEEPLHWLADSPDPIHSGDPATRAARAAQMHATRTTGAGLGLSFGVAMANATNVPVGLVACAHGGTSMAQWSPSKKGEGGMSLYGSMLRQVKLAGGKVKGVLWYQGESDTPDVKTAEAFGQAFADFIASVRGDLGRPDLPFYFVQLGRVIGGADPRPWNIVQEAQREIPERVAHTAVVPAIDLDLDDAIHISTPGQKRLGERLARIALRELFGQVGASTPTLDRVSKGADGSLVVKFKDVNRSPSARAMGGTPKAEGLRPARHIAGFSIRGADGQEIPMIFEAMVGPSRDAVVLKLAGQVPAGSFLWYGWGRDPYCNLTDALDMAVPVFGPFALDAVK